MELRVGLIAERVVVEGSSKLLLSKHRVEELVDHIYHFQV